MAEFTADVAAVHVPGGPRTRELAAAGVNAETPRHYERRGLLAEPGRGLGRHRQYWG